MATTCAAASLPFVIPTWLSLVSIVIVASTAFLGAFGGVRLALRADRQSKSENNESTRDFQHGNSEGALSRVDSSQSSTQPAPEVSLESAQPRVHNEETTTDVGDAGGLPTAFVCCITSELFLNPVVASDGHSYERAAIEKWFERHNTSPSTGERLHSKEVIPNHNLRSQVLEYRRAEGLPDPPPWVPTEPTEAPAATTAAADAESSSPTTASTSGPTANVAGAAGAGGATPRQFRINIPQAEATALLASIRQVLDRSPALLAEMGLAQVGATNFPSENEQAAARILADPRLLSLVARHAAGTSGLEPLAPRLTRAAHSISQLLANEMQAQRVAQHQAPASQPIRPVPQGLAAANAAPTSAAMASGGSGASGGLVPPDDPPLHRAARAGDCGAVQRELLALQRTQPHLFASPTPRSGPGSGNGSSPSQQQHWATADRPRDRFGESLLAVACQHGHLDLVRMLTSPAFGANPALPSLRGGTTPLHHAARTAHSGILQCLLDALKALSSEGHGNTSTTALASALKARNHAGETPLHAAAGRRIGTFGLGGASNNSPAEDSSAAVAACTALLAAGADVSAVTENGCSALHLAALVPGRSGVAELLLREGALPDAQEFVKHSTPVHHAAQSGDPLMLHAILGHVQRDATKRASEARASSSGGGDEDSDAVEAAGRAAASVLANQAGKRGLVPLHCAAASGSALAVRALVSDYGARLDARGELDGASPLTVAVVRRHVEALQEILALGGSVAEDTAHAVSRGLDGPVHLAIAASRPDIATLLFDHGAPLDARTKNESTVLHLAAWFGLRDLATVVLDKQPSMLSDVTEDGDTALHQAAFNDHTEVCLLLLERGADPNSQKRDGSTALHLCVAKGFLRVVRLLLSRGADPKITNARGLDVLSLAHAANQPNVAAVLNEHLGRSAPTSS